MAQLAKLTAVSHCCANSLDLALVVLGGGRLEVEVGGLPWGVEGGHCPGRSESDRSDRTLGVREAHIELLECIIQMIISSELSGVESTQKAM